MSRSRRFVGGAAAAPKERSTTQIRVGFLLLSPDSDGGFGRRRIFGNK
jgi:hypothetical protein